jgi:hypothetical protein
MGDKHSPAPARSRSKRWIAAALGVVGLLLLVMLLYNRPHEIAGSQDTAAPRDRATPPQRSGEIELASPRQSIVEMLAPLPDKSGGLEVCGFGDLKLDHSDPLGVARPVGALARKADAQWKSALLDSDDYRARAVGLMLQGGNLDGDAASVEQARDALVQLATGAADPAVYAMAVHLCDTYADPSPSGSCQRISLREWANIDPDNAVPWLYVADKARAANDAAALTDALGRAAAAHKTDSYNWSLFAYAQPEMPAAATPFEQYYLATELIGYEATWFGPQYTVASKLCSADAVQDERVRQPCDALAELLVSRGTTLLDLGIGESIGAHVGWPSERLTALTQERNALMQSLMQPMATGSTDPWDCTSVRLGNELVRQIARLGELGAARDALERSGETVQEMAQRQTELMEKIRREAAERREQQEDAAASTAP